MPTLEFSPQHDLEFFAAVPAGAAVFALHGHAGGAPYVSRSTNLRRRLLRLLRSPTAPAGTLPGEPPPGAAAPTRGLNLRDRAARLEYWPAGSDFEAQLVLYRVLRRYYPERYRERLRLRPAPLVKFDLANPYPRAYVTTKLGRLRGPSIYYGPFASRPAAEKFLNDSLDLFRIRRCPDDLNPDPAFPGCIYSEMKMCLAPCFRGCSDEQYTEEVRRVQRYLDSAGESLYHELEAQRDHASRDLDFENAASLHARLGKAAEAAGQRPEIARRIDELNGLMIQPSATPGAVKFFRIEHGAIGEPFDFIIARDAAGELLAPEAGQRQPQSRQPISRQPISRQPISMEARIADALEQAPPAASLASGELADHLALLRRWFFRSSKAGELFLTERRGEGAAELPMRRVVRGVSRVFSGQSSHGAAMPELQPKKS
ncbi:MAG TPA: hypothetical protein VE998_06875 [Terriglobales bacterium]|nr:hypothetical protein [Terriglobales bacterium]